MLAIATSETDPPTGLSGRFGAWLTDRFGRDRKCASLRRAATPQTPRCLVDAGKCRTHARAPAQSVTADVILSPNSRFEIVAGKMTRRRPLEANGAQCSGLDAVLHAIALALDDDRLGVMQKPVEECRGERGIVVEDLRPVLEHPVGGDDGRAVLVAQADDLKQQIGAGLIDRQIAEFVKNEQRRLAVAVQRLFQAPAALGGGERIDHLHSGREAHAMALQAGGIAERGGQMGLTEADRAEQDHVVLVGDEVQSEQVLYLQAIDRLRPTPLELLQGLEHRKACLGDASLHAALAPQRRLARRQTGQIGDVIPMRLCRLLG